MIVRVPIILVKETKDSLGLDSDSYEEYVTTFVCNSSSVKGYWIDRDKKFIRVVHIAFEFDSPYSSETIKLLDSCLDDSVFVFNRNMM